MHAPPILDARLAHVPGDRWERAALIRERGWLREVRAEGASGAGATCMGLVGVRGRVDRSTLEARCDCGGAAPCEHALALLAEVGVLAPPPQAAAAEDANAARRTRPAPKEG